MADKTHYEVLGVSPQATEKEIKAAYRKLSKKLHPDFGGDPRAFAKVAEAADVLSDAASRESYDRELRQAKARAEATKKQPPPRSGPTGSRPTPPRADYEPPPPPAPPKIIVPCPHCGTKNRVLDLPVIVSAKCGKCGQAFPIERPEPDSYAKILRDLVNGATSADLSHILNNATDKLKQFNSATREKLERLEQEQRKAPRPKPSFDPDDPVARAEAKLRDLDDYLDR